MSVKTIPVSVPMQLEGQSSPKVVPLEDWERWISSIHTDPPEILFFPFSVFLPQIPSSSVRHCCASLRGF